jgi:hypothetical protein
LNKSMMNIPSECNSECASKTMRGASGYRKNPKNEGSGLERKRSRRWAGFRRLV